jgi:hypothetical protein
MNTVSAASEKPEPVWVRRNAERARRQAEELVWRQNNFAEPPTIAFVKAAPRDVKASRRRPRSVTPVGHFLAAARAATAAAPLTPAHGDIDDESAEEAHRFKRKVQERSGWDPAADVHAVTDTHRTVVVAKLGRDTTEATVRSTCQGFGPVTTVRLIRTEEGESRRYAFVEFARAADARAAVRDGSGAVIDEVVIVIEMEKGRADRARRNGFLPRRLRPEPLLTGLSMIFRPSDS